VTVPAFWNDRSKANVRAACIQAGLITNQTRQNLVIIIEPEAAALYSLRYSKLMNVEDNEIFMIFDAGGGTVDVTVHQLKFIDRLKEYIGVSSETSTNRHSITNSSETSNNRHSMTNSQVDVNRNLDIYSLSLKEIIAPAGRICGSARIDVSFLDLFYSKLSDNARLYCLEVPDEIAICNGVI
jgi:hypothetical protein